MDNTYIPVSSNDTLLHLAMSGSPETLCGRLVVDRERHPSASDVALKCDVCDTLSGGNSFLKYTDSQEEGVKHLASHHDIDLALVSPVILENEENLDLFHKQAHIEEGTEFDGPYEESFERTAATNYTRDGIKIEDGFNLVISSDDAADIPFLDSNRITISQLISCPGCEQDTWISKVASCTDCGELKCNGCMDDSSLDYMLGTCRKCASIEEEEESYYLNVYDDVDYSLIQRTATFSSDEEDDDETFFLPTLEN